MRFSCFLAFLWIFSTLSAQPSVIPKPVAFEFTGSVLPLDKGLAFDVQTDDPMVLRAAEEFREYLLRSGLQVADRPERAAGEVPVLRVSVHPAPREDLGAEGYSLKVREDGIALTANQPAGLFYGFQTLRQLFPAAMEAPVGQPVSDLSLATCQIEDFPRFGWRGLMLDVSRHFFTVEEVKAFLDRMAHYKFNTFHWHLTDDEGWRMEIKSLPRLTEVGAWRVERHGRFGASRPYPLMGEKATYGGFYTQEQIREVVAYAAERNITIVPEIDMPGHSMAALAAYPELSTRKEPKFVNPGSKFAEWHGDGTFTMLIENTLNPADEAVYEFVDKVFTEVAALFPGPYIHMGGDEAYHGYWEESEEVRAFMEEHDIEDGHGLQSYFVTRVNEIINSKGKQMIGWDEILEGGLTEGAAVMSWRGMQGGIEAAKKGHPVVMSPTTYAYLDYTQGDPSVENPIYADLSLEKCYQFDPVPEGVDPALILGGQGNLWTEAIPTLPFAFYMAYPRALALSETLWSPESSKDWEDFIGRVESQFDRFDAAGINISKAVYEPQVHVYREDGRLMCRLSTAIPDAEIFFTIDNTYPVTFGQKYERPFVIPEGRLSLRARTFRDDQPLGRALLIPREELVERAE